MKLEFDIRMKAGDLYDFMLYHTYTGFSGILGTVAGVLLIVYFSMTLQWIYLFAGLLIVLYLPCSLYLRSKRQVLTNEFFREEIHYVFTEEGITVSQGEQSDTLPWDQVVKAVASPHSIFLYTSRVNAWIFPKKILGEQRVDLIQMISEHVAPAKVKIKQ